MARPAPDLTDPDLDVIAIGRAAIDLYGEQAGGRLEDMGSFAKYIGGSPCNTAIGAARLGLKSAMISRVGADHFGRFVVEELVREGVDVAAIAADPTRLTGLVFLGIRDREQFPLLFYRRDCADMALTEADVDPAYISRAAATVLSGTHLSTPTVFAASLKAARAAKAAGRKVAFDIDYRPVLWGVAPQDGGENRYVADAAVTTRLREVAPLCDLIVGTEEEFRILGGEDDTEAALRAVRRESAALLVCKRGPLGCVAFPGGIGAGFADGVARRGVEVEVFNVLGAGDAFMAGFLRGWLRGERLERSLDFANACGAIVVSRHGCATAMPTWPELQGFLGGHVTTRRLREDAALEHLHWATTRRGAWPELFVLALDHRPQFEALAAEAGADPARIAAFKTLGLRAAMAVAQTGPAVGVLLDDAHGLTALEQSTDTPLWVGRPIEVAGSRPLAFQGGADVGATLREWPLAQVIKCLVRLHPDDPPDLAERQVRQLQRLFHAARATRHELLVEIIAGGSGAVDGSTVARAMGQVYDAAVMPDWWKLEPNADPAAWDAIAAIIEARDPLCRGVLLLGGGADEAAATAGFAAAAAQPMVKGFAIGRTIWEAPAKAWLAGKSDDEAATAAMAQIFERLIGAWRHAKAPAGAKAAAE